MSPEGKKKAVLAATQYNTLQHTASHSISLHLTATHCNTLQHTATQYNSLQHSSSTMSPEDKKKAVLAEVNAFGSKVGKVEVWRIANFDMVPLDPSTYGQVYTHCNSLPLTATHSTSLHLAATRCNPLQFTASRRISLQLAASHCFSLQLTATHWNSLKLAATHCISLQHSQL